MSTLAFTLEEPLSLPGVPRSSAFRSGRSESLASRRGPLKAPGATAVADTAAAAAADLDDWSGSFDIHLGVYTTD